MKTKIRRMKTTRGPVMAPGESSGYYTCLCSGTRHPCTYHCKKCILETIYCSK